MPIARERIVPVAPRRAWLCYAGLGLAVGVPLAPIVYKGAYLLMHQAELGALGARNSWWPSLLIALGVVVGLSPLGAILVLMRVTQRWGAVLGFAAGQIGVMWLVLEASKVLSRADGGVRVSQWLTPWLVGLAAIEVAGYLALAAAVRSVYRLLIVRAVEHDPGDCAWCGYTRGSDLITRCPECGRAATPPRFRAYWLVMGVNRLARRGVMIGSLVLVMLAVLAAEPVWTRTIPTLRFYARFREALPLGPGAWGFAPSALSAGGTRDMPGVWIPPPGRDGRGVYILLATGVDGAPRGMVVGISGHPDIGLPMGSMRIHSDLNGRQAAYVLSHGLPPELVHALDAAAEEVAWTAESVPRGQKYVRAVPFFPPVPPR